MTGDVKPGQSRMEKSPHTIHPDPDSIHPPTDVPEAVAQADGAGKADKAVYWMLLALNLFSILMIAWSSVTMRQEFSEISSEVSFWSDAAHRGAMLSKAAREVTAPVNDVFNSRSPGHEQTRLRTKLEELRAMVETEKDRLRLLSVSSQRDLAAANLQQAERQLHRLSESALETLKRYGDGDEKRAVASMAFTDSTFREFMDTMDSRSDVVAGIQSDILKRDEQFRNALGNFLLVFLMLVACLAASATAYGLRLSQKARAAFETVRDGERKLAVSDTRLRALNTELQLLLDSRQRFVADAAHQLRTPVAGIKLQVERALRGNSIEDCKSALSKALVSADRLAHLAEQLLTLAKADPGMRAARVLKEIDLSALARDAALEWLPSASDKNIHMEFDAEKSPVMIQADQPLVFEMLSNVIDNAARHTPPHGRISVKVGATPAPSFTVEDTGPGIPESERDKVFDRFYRLPDSAGNGSGLGLAIAQEIAAYHDASVTIAPSTGDGGLRLRITFPSIGQPQVRDRSG
jgi:signal transduction histidine kinase